MKKPDRIYVAGHRGLVGSALLRTLAAAGCTGLITRDRKDLDLRDPSATEDFFRREQPEYVFLAAARVGGILANATYGADFLYDNLMISCNVIEAARRHAVRKLLYLGSSCIYPRLAPQPLQEEALLSGPLEPTNEPYAIAKIAGIKLCRYFNAQHGTNFISVMPANLYGPNDNFHPVTSHVLPALIRRIWEAKQNAEPCVEIWGDGSPRRELLFVDDLAGALVWIMETFDAADIGELINIGTGEDVTIRELAHLIAGIVGYHGRFQWDTSKPNGTPRKVLDVARINRLGWRAQTGLKEGIALTVEWYKNHTVGSCRPS